MVDSTSVPPLISSVFPSIHTISELVITPLHADDKEPEPKVPGSEEEVSYEIGFRLSPGRPGSVDEFNIGGFGNEVDAVIRLTRDKVYWIFPTISSTLPSNVDTQILLVRLRSGHAAAVLPLTTPLYMGTFRGSQFGTVVARFEKDSKTNSSKTFASVVVSFGSKIQDVVRNVVDCARIVRFGKPGIPRQLLPAENHIFTNTLTYCTWNSLHPPTLPTSNNALATLRYFAENGIYPTSFLIDDAWQDYGNLRLQSFGSNPSFLDGMEHLGQLVEQAKTVYGVKRVGAWHTIQGYWCGVEPTNFIEKYRLVKVTKVGHMGFPLAYRNITLTPFIRMDTLAHLSQLDLPIISRILNRLERSSMIITPLWQVMVSPYRINVLCLLLI
ncbi:hypothetical protein FRC02_000221 [Tulasnella sp. 418]|nr:hypothetical protein FRC02_000221 [Tulasnella sp. 418]